MRRRVSTLVCFAVLGCARSSHERANAIAVDPAPSRSIVPAVAASSTSSAPSAPIECLSDERPTGPSGTTCCRVERFGPDMGQWSTTCRGLQIGAPCTRKQDCDLFCEAPAGVTKDGISGLIGRCAGALLPGVRIEQLDENGKSVTVIYD